MVRKLRALWKTLGWFFLGMVILFSLTPSTPAPPSLWDKAQHFIAYGWLMFWFSCAFANHKTTVAGVLVMIGIILEGIQFLLPYRSFDLFDIVANSSGILIGWIVASTLLGKHLFGLKNY